LPTAPRSKVAVKVAMSSFSTGSVSSPTSTIACPTAAASGTGRSVTAVWKMAPPTVWTGPQRNSARSTMCVPMSASAPEPGSPW
jgi:hypothetical protein